MFWTVLKQNLFTFQNKTFLLNIYLNIEGLKVCQNEAFLRCCGIKERGGKKRKGKGHKAHYLRNIFFKRTLINDEMQSRGKGSGSFTNTILKFGKKLKDNKHDDSKGNSHVHTRYGDPDT